MKNKWKIGIIVAIVALLVCTATVTFALWDKSRDDADLTFDVGDRLALSVNNVVVGSELDSKKLVPPSSILGSNESYMLTLGSANVKLERFDGTAMPNNIKVKWTSTATIDGNDVITSIGADVLIIKLYSVDASNNETEVAYDTASSIIANNVGDGQKVIIKVSLSGNITQAQLSKIALKNLAVKVMFDVVIS